MAGVISSILTSVFDNEYFPFKTLYLQSRAVPDRPTASFRGFTVIITGASGIVCSKVASLLIDLGASTLIFAVPDIAEGEDGVPKLEALLGTDRISKASVLVWHLDLLSFESVRAFAKRAAKLPRLDVVVMGATTIQTQRKVSPDGFEYSLQVIHLSCALLTLLLIPVLVKSAEKHNTVAVLTAITTLSIRQATLLPIAQAPAGGLLGAVDKAEGYIARLNQYGMTKLLFIHWFRELSSRWSSTDLGGQPQPRSQLKRLQLHLCDFGVSSDRASSAGINWEARIVQDLIGRPSEICARVVVQACVAQEGTHGKLFLDYDIIPYYNFMTTPSGRSFSQIVWAETKQVLGSVSPEAERFYEFLGG